LSRRRRRRPRERLALIAERELTLARRGVDFHKVESEREKQSGEQLERTQMGLGSSSDR
jgi:hypothetical protein